MTSSGTLYRTIKKPSSCEFSDRGSKFIAYSFIVENQDDVKQYLREIKLQHSKAVHHCFAYRIGFDKNHFRAVDDGEPSGSAGRPILGQIDRAGCTNVLVIVVRYFGGVLLGIPGLINAYKTAGKMVLELSDFHEVERMSHYNLKFDYLQLNAIMGILKSGKCEIKQLNTGLFCELTATIAQSIENQFLEQIKLISGVQVERLPN